MVTVAPLLDGAGDPLDAYTATFTRPTSLPVLLEWLQDGTDVVGAELVAGYVPSAAAEWFTVAEARALPGPNGGVLSDVVKYPDAAIEEQRYHAQTAIEEALGVYFTPTAFTETLDGGTGRYVKLKTRHATSLTSVTLDGATLTDAVLYVDGRVYRPAGWFAVAPQTLLIEGVAGFPSCPPRVKHAGLLLTKRWLVDTHVSDRATTVTGQDGSSQYFVTAGVKGALFDVPEVNALQSVYGIRTGRMVA